MSFLGGLIQLHFRFSSEGERMGEKRMDADENENDDGAWEGEGEGGRLEERV